MFSQNNYIISNLKKEFKILNKGYLKTSMLNKSSRAAWFKSKI